MLLKFIGRTLLRHNTEHFQRELLLLSNTKAGLGRLLNMTSFQINLLLTAQQISWLNLNVLPVGGKFLKTELILTGEN